MPLQATSGAASYDGFGGGAAAVPNYIEDVFSTYLYDGNSSTQTITNGIDLSTKGGLVWAKSRNTANFHLLVDTVRGFNSEIYSNSTSAASTSGSDYTSWNTNGYSLGFISGNENVSGRSFVSWTFREQPKFFDVVTYTGNGVDNRDIAHSLGSTPGCIIVKCTNSTPAWRVFHRSLTAGNNMELNATDGQFADTAIKSCTDTTFRTNSGSNSNGSGNSYVAYLFAHDAGGFGLTGTDNVISCGSFTASSGAATVTLGYEPAWVLMKQTNGADNWYITDSMREFLAPPLSDTQKTLRANTSGAELADGLSAIAVTSTGFNAVNVATTGEYIYIAIRRGPMKVPTLGTSVYQAVTRAGTGAVATISSLGFPTDFTLIKTRTASLGYDWNLYDRLRGAKQRLATNSTNSESTETNGLQNYALMNGYGIGASNEINSTSDNFVDYNFRRAPGFFDEVCYTGTGSATTVTHNLTVAPQMMIIKRRSSGADWTVYHVAMGANKYTFLDGSTELSSATIWNATTPTASVFSVGPEYYVNYAANTYVAYLFATLAGVSKVGSYTGTGALQTVNCGFTTGARFVLIHRIDSGSNDWFVYDSARGITSGNDPYLALNSTAAEVTSTNYVDTDTTGFKVTAAAPAGLNANGGTFIFLAIA